MACGIIQDRQFMTITWKNFLISLAVVLAITGIFLFGYTSFGLFFRLHSPFKNDWQTVHLSNGQIFYGHIYAMNGSVLELSDAYSLETFKKATSTARVYDNSNSENFALGGDVEEQTKQILTKQAKAIYFSWPSVSYWENISPAEEIFKYLQ